MKAIQTRIIPATDTKGTRIKAFANGVKAVIMSRNSAEDMAKSIVYPVSDDESYMTHLMAAKTLADKYQWLIGWSLVGGTLPNGDMAWVFVKD